MEENKEVFEPVSDTPVKENEPTLDTVCQDPDTDYQDDSPASDIAEQDEESALNPTEQKEESDIQEETQASAKDPNPAAKKIAAAYISIILILVAVVIICAVLFVTKMFNDDGNVVDGTELTATPSASTDNSVTDPAVTDPAVTGNVVSSPDGTDNITGTSGEASGTDDSTTPAPTAAVFVIDAALGQYTGITVDYPDTTVTEEDITNELMTLCEANPIIDTITDRPVQNGDTVNIDFTGYIDDVAFDGGTGTNHNLAIGSGEFIPGFEEGLIGAESGATLKINVTFPENYDEAFAGKAAVFDVTINSISTSTVPELTDDFIAANTDSATIEDYKTILTADLLEENKATAIETVRQDILSVLIDNCTYTGDIDAAINDGAEKAAAYYDNMANSYYGVSGLELFSYIYGYTAEQYYAYIYSEAEYSVKYQYALDAVAKAENMSLSDEEFEFYMNDIFINYYGYETKEAVYEAIGEAEAKEHVNTNGLRQKAEDFIIAHAIVNGKPEDVEIISTPVE